MSAPAQAPSAMPFRIRLADAADADAVATIYNQGIAERAATFETVPRTPTELAQRIGEDPRRFPVLVAEDATALLGWSAIGPYRPRACYAGIGDFSVYVDGAARGRGVGRALVTALIAEAAQRGYWKLLSRIFPFNTASLALCRSLGFREVGVYEKHARLEGRSARRRDRRKADSGESAVRDASFSGDLRLQGRRAIERSIPTNRRSRMTTPTNPATSTTQLAGKTAAQCCPPAEQSSCCAPAQKAACCEEAESGSCGCR